MPNPGRDANDTRARLREGRATLTAVALITVLACTPSSAPPPPSEGDPAPPVEAPTAQPVQRDDGPALRVGHLMRPEQARAVSELAEREAPVRVELSPLEANGLDELVEALKADGAPDVVQVDLTWVPELVAAGALEEIGAEVDLSEHLRPLGGLVALDGGVWAHPDRAWCQVVYAHKGLLEGIGLTRAPSDWDGLLRAARLLTVDRQGRHSLHPEFDRGEVVRHGLFIRSDLESTWGLFTSMGGGTVSVSSQEALIHGAGGVKAARWLQGLRGRHGVTPGWLDAPVPMEEAVEIFATGRVAMLVGSSAWMEALVGQGQVKREGEVWIGALPVEAGRGGCPAAGSGYVVVRGGDERSRQAAAWLASEQVQGELARRHRVVPSRVTSRSALVGPNRLNSAWMVEALHATGHARDRAVFPGMARLGESLNPALEAIARGKQEPTEALRRVSADWRVLLVETNQAR